MFRLALAALRAKKARLLLSAAAIALGVAFISGTLVLTDTLGEAYDSITAQTFEGTDAVVRSDQVVTATNDTTVRATVDDAVLAEVRSTPGVAVAEPVIEGVAQLVGSDGKLLDSNRNRATPIAFGWFESPDLNPMDLVAGHAPSSPSDIVIDKASADSFHLAIGDAVRVITATGSAPYRIAGIGTYAGADDAAGAHVVAFEQNTAASVLGQPGEYDSIRVVAAPGVSESQLAASLGQATVTSPDVEVLTGTEAVADAKAQTHEGLAFLTTFLLAFALVSLVVGSVVIANAFSITVAQRSRESALLRAIGASKRQVTTSMVAEAFVTGVVASIVGVGIGVGLASGLKSLLAAIGLDLPATSLVVQPRVAVIGVVVGTVVTVLATYLPCRRAAKIAPVAAMRSMAIESTSRSTARTVIGSLLTAGGAALVAAGLSGSSAPAVGAGAVGCFFGVIVLSPIIAPRAARVLGAPMARMAGVTGKLARENARRNPKRTAATAKSLMIGLGLVAFMTVFGASVTSSFRSTVDNALRGDWIVSTVFGQGGVSDEVARTIDELPQTGAVSGLRYTAATVAGHVTDVAAVDPAAIDELVDVDTRDGRIEDVSATSMAVRSDVADSHHWSVGDRVEVDFPQTGQHTFTIAAIYKALDPLGPYTISIDTYDQNVTDHTDRFVFVSNAPGYSSNDVNEAVSKVLAPYPTAELQTGAEFATSATEPIQSMLNLVYALLALAVVIALFGIANTLALSVHERRRELGLLRAVGMHRSQVRTMVRSESVIISVFGTLMGMVIGIGLAAALVNALHSQGIDRLAVPASPLAAVTVFGVVAGLACAAFPARRAAAIDMLAALHAD